MAVLNRLRGWMRRRPVDAERALRHARAETRLRAARQRGALEQERGMPHASGGGFDMGGGL